MQIVTDHLTVADQILFRDAYESAPDVFDPGEFLSDSVPDIDVLVEHYTSIWLKDFQNNITR